MQIYKQENYEREKKRYERVKKMNKRFSGLDLDTMKNVRILKMKATFENDFYSQLWLADFYATYIFDNNKFIKDYLEYMIIYRNKF